jgi:hypothetical protein
MAKKVSAAAPDEGDDDLIQKLYRSLERLISAVPGTSERERTDPHAHGRQIVGKAAAKAALVAAGLALPPGPLGILSMRIQAQMVADVAGVFGKTDTLTREQMVYCLFKHGAAQLFRDVVVRVGQRYLIRRTSLRIMQRILTKISIKLTQRVIGKAISRWFPFIGPVTVGTYAYFDTLHVGNTAIELFEREITLEEQPDNDEPE